VFFETWISTSLKRCRANEFIAPVKEPANNPTSTAVGPTIRLLATYYVPARINSYIAFPYDKQRPLQELMKAISIKHIYYVAGNNGSDG
jgi:hypothetical protein